MKLRNLTIALLSFLAISLQAQTYNEYELSFDNAVHHEANIKIKFSNLENKVLEVRMSRSSPGRYAVHEFAKNVYNVKATDGNGKALPITRENPYQWNVAGHNGTVHFEYTLYANRAGGTYSGIDESHAHLNMPATLAWARGLDQRPVKVKFNVREDRNWKVATQLKDLGNNTFYAPNTYYLMDSPTEIADLYFRERNVDGQTIRLALHKDGTTDAEVDAYFEETMGIVMQQKAVFGELATYDFGQYTFLSCYMPNASGDGMEHRNSTYVVSGLPVERPLGSTSMGTMSHEFFHSWNVERIRPKSLEPFSFEDANMSGELWFAEGFTSYYTALMQARSGSISAEQYINGLGGSVGYVVNAPGRNFHNPIEMSYQAPFVDAATSIDPTNLSNIFISYYTYGSVLGLALDMSLRTMDNGKNLDDYMKYVWEKQGKTEIPYTVRDLQARMAEYAGESFANEFFGKYILDSQMPDYASLFKKMGVTYTNRAEGRASIGGNIRKQRDGWQLTGNATVGSPIYKAGVESEDVILSLAGTVLTDDSNINEIIAAHKPGDTIEIKYRKIWGEEKTSKLILEEAQAWSTAMDAKADAKAKARREAWLRKR
ncbi:putative metalloprotease with PDZ domain [Roseivirga ehrenbergii]|uniref:Peptidase M61 n=1 Tax=Roseivirga ehrenbergii (strain DSM 102268 / JCM 13514 / KCTC 12282 / NCIMB 14502 / KMM 6017) TaxID=279360 RepID=A0A150XTX9_ROSEK|nr:PDZ domain-containing protein [Roseivirga ehrenbergii]KYG82136.1 peptidase M61 [Roseivirga ehrenbergii]TCL01960.1 putative metalloprotease with PDZ domain [Roseivirga ehrenbergii]